MLNKNEGDEKRLRQRLKKRWRQGLAKLRHYLHDVRHTVARYRARYGNRAAFTVTIALFFAASTALLPTLQALLETQLTTIGSVERVQNLLLNTGSALIGAAAIVTSLVLFAMQVNVERMPHGLFRRLSEDRKLLGAFGTAFVLAISVAVMSIVAEQARLALVLVSAVWLILFILGLFLYAYRRALRLINPLEQLRILLNDTRKELCRWSRRAERAKPGQESEQQAVAELLPEAPTPDTSRTQFFRLNAHWADGTKRSMHHAMSFARRYAEQRDYEVSGHALEVVVGINAAYVEAKGKTFYADTLLAHPLAHDDFITECLECMRQNADSAIGRRDERQIEQFMQALAALAGLYLRIDYASPAAEKSHAQLAAGYLGNTVQAVVDHDMADVLMEGQRLLGRVGQHFVTAGCASDIALLSEKIASIALTGCMKGRYRPVTMEGVRQHANLTLYLLRSPGHDIPYALGKVRENAFMIAKQVLKVPDSVIADIHATTLAAYYSSGDMQSFIVKLTHLVNSVAAASADDEGAQTVIRNVKHWADELFSSTKDLLLAAIAVRSHFTIHMFQWIRGMTEILLVASNAPACDRHSQRELRSHARWLIATLSWIPEDQESVTFVEMFQFTDMLFGAAMDARRHGRDENVEEIGSFLLSWAFKGGRHITCCDILEQGLYGCAALAFSGPSGPGDALRKDICQRLQTDGAPTPEVRARVAEGLRRRAAAAARPGYAARPSGYALSTIDRAISRLDKTTLGPLLDEIAEVLCPRTQ